MSAAKLLLTVESTQDYFFSGTALMGVSCRLPDYRLGWRLNQCLNTGFYRNRELDLWMQKGETQTVLSIFVYDLPLSSGTYYLYQLRKGNVHLIPDLPNLDYLWLFKSNQSQEEAAFFLPFVRQIPEVRFAQIYSPDQLKARSNLIL